MLAGLSVVGIRYYQDHESPKEIEEPLLNYISTGLYNHLDPIRIKDALLNQGWDPALVDQYVDIIGFILSNIELDPNIDNIIDQLFSSGWNMQLAKGFVHEVSIRFFQLEIQRHRGIPISTMYNMLIDDGYPKDLVDQAFARINR